MGTLKKQGFYNLITLYLGLILGFFNLVFLFNRTLKLEEIGFFNMMIALSTLFLQFSTLGFGSVISKYFPFFKTDDKKHNGLPTFVFIICLTGFIACALLYFSFKGLILNVHAADSGVSLFENYYYYIIPLSFCLMLYSIQEGFLRANYKSVFPAFLREVLLKVFTTGGVLLISLSIIDYSNFVIYYIVSNAVLVLSLFLYGYYVVKAFKFSRVSIAVKSKYPEIFKFAFYSMLGGSSVVLVQNLDVIILGLLSDEETVGIYSTFFLIAVVVSLPSKALGTTSYQIVADAWRENDLDKIGSIYQKTSLVQLLIGSLFLVGLIVNKENLLMLLHKQEYAPHFGVLILVGLGYLTDVTGGLNGVIISYSPFYKVVMLGLIIAAVLCAILNFLLIPPLGISGAAISYLLTMFSLNFIYSFFIKWKFGLQPFGFRHLLVIGISIISLVVGLFLPQSPNLIVDVLVRSGLVTFIFMGLAFCLKLSPEINGVLVSVFRKVNHHG